jgi:hypothetical protein
MWGQVFDPSGRAKLDPLLLWRGRPRPRCLREGHGFSRADKSLTPFVILSERSLRESKDPGAPRDAPAGRPKHAFGALPNWPRDFGERHCARELLGGAGGAALQRCIKTVFMNTGFSP